MHKMSPKLINKTDRQLLKSKVIIMMSLNLKIISRQNLGNYEGQPCKETGLIFVAKNTAIRVICYIYQEATTGPHKKNGKLLWKYCWKKPCLGLGEVVCK